jgi:lipopolysaccharide export system permease protein
MKKMLTNFLVQEFFYIFNPIFFGLMIMSMALRFAKIYEMGGIKLPLKDIFYTLMLLLPAVSQIIAPIAFLIAISITLTKLSSSNELTALQTAGVSLEKILKIFTCIALLITIFNIVISVFVKPQCSFLLKKNMDLMAQGRILATPQEKVFSKIYKDYYLYVNSASAADLHGVIFIDMQPDKESTIIAAEKCIIENEEGVNLFKFYDGNYLKLDKGMTNIIDFDKLSVNPFEDFSLQESDVRAGAMPLITLIKSIKATSKPSLETELFYRFFFPLSVMVFLFLSFPFSIGHSRNYKTTGIMISISVGLVFYVFFSVIKTLSTKGLVSPFFGFFITTTVLILLGLKLCHRKISRI